MNVLVDTPVWSLALRRRAADLSGREQGLARALSELIRTGQVQIVGAVRQELLSGIREEERFRKLRDYLRAFEEPMLEAEDYEQAARFHNQCRTQGIAGSAIDFLICAVAFRRDWEVFTTDLDFERYARIVQVKLHSPA